MPCRVTVSRLSIFAVLWGQICTWSFEDPPSSDCCSAAVTGQVPQSDVFFPLPVLSYKLVPAGEEGSSWCPLVAAFRHLRDNLWPPRHFKSVFLLRRDFNWLNTKLLSFKRRLLWVSIENPVRVYFICLWDECTQQWARSTVPPHESSCSSS